MLEFSTRRYLGGYPNGEAMNAVNLVSKIKFELVSIGGNCEMLQPALGNLMESWGAFIEAYTVASTQDKDIVRKEFNNPNTLIHLYKVIGMLAKFPKNAISANNLTTILSLFSLVQHPDYDFVATLGNLIEAAQQAGISPIEPLLKEAASLAGNSGIQKSSGYLIKNFCFTASYRRRNFWAVLNPENINAPDPDDGQTPLIKAVIHSNKTMVKLLLDRGALIDPRDSLGCNAVDYAVINGYFEILGLLLNRQRQGISAQGK